MSVSVGFEIALLCRCDDTAALHKAEPMCHKLRQAVTAKPTTPNTASGTDTAMTIIKRMLNANGR